MRLEMLVASEDATQGSVIAKQERISPFSSGCSHCSCCNAVPNWARISMLPVSGAAQLVASDEQRRAAHHLAERRVVEVRQLDAVVALGHEQVPEAATSGLGLQVFHHRRREMRVSRFRALVPVHRLGRPHDFRVEREQLVLQLVGAGAGCEVHVASSRRAQSIRRGRATPSRSSLRHSACFVALRRRCLVGADSRKGRRLRRSGELARSPRSPRRETLRCCGDNSIRA